MRKPARTTGRAMRVMRVACVIASLLAIVFAAGRWLWQGRVTADVIATVAIACITMVAVGVARIRTRADHHADRAMAVPVPQDRPARSSGARRRRDDTRKQAASTSPFDV